MINQSDKRQLLYLFALLSGLLTQHEPRWIEDNGILSGYKKDIEPIRDKINQLPDAEKSITWLTECEQVLTMRVINYTCSPGLVDLSVFIDEQSKKTLRDIIEKLSLATLDSVLLFQQSQVWENAFDLLIELEGHKSDNPADPGGLTIFGITRRYYPEVIERIQGMPYDEQLKEAKDFYFQNYWFRYMRLHDDLIPAHAAAFYTARLICEVNVGEPRVLLWLLNTTDYQTLLLNSLDYYLKKKDSQFFAGWISRIAKTFRFIKERYG